MKISQHQLEGSLCSFSGNFLYFSISWSHLLKVVFFGCTWQDVGSQFPNHESIPCPLQWKHWVPTTGQPVNSWLVILKLYSIGYNRHVPSFHKALCSLYVFIFMVRVVNYLLSHMLFTLFIYFFFTFTAQLCFGQSHLTTLSFCFFPNFSNHWILGILGINTTLKTLQSVGICFETYFCTQRPAKYYHCGNIREEDEVQILLLRNNLEIRHQNK